MNFVHQDKFHKLEIQRLQAIEFKAYQAFA